VGQDTMAGVPLTHLRPYRYDQCAQCARRSRAPLITISRHLCLLHEC